MLHRLRWRLSQNRTFQFVTSREVLTIVLLTGVILLAVLLAYDNAWVNAPHA